MRSLEHGRFLSPNPKRDKQDDESNSKDSNSNGPSNLGKTRRLLLRSFRNHRRRNVFRWLHHALPLGQFLQLLFRQFDTTFFQFLLNGSGEILSPHRRDVIVHHNVYEFPCSQ